MNSQTSLETSERAKRIVERLHTPFDNEKRWAIVEEELSTFKVELQEYIQEKAAEEIAEMTIQRIISKVCNWILEYK